MNEIKLFFISLLLKFRCSTPNIIILFLGIFLHWLKFIRANIKSGELVLKNKNTDTIKIIVGYVRARIYSNF